MGPPQARAQRYYRSLDGTPDLPDAHKKNPTLRMLIGGAGLVLCACLGLLSAGRSTLASPPAMITGNEKAFSAGGVAAPAISIEPNTVEEYCLKNPEDSECFLEWKGCPSSGCEAFSSRRLMRYGPSESGDYLYTTVEGGLTTRDVTGQLESLSDSGLGVGTCYSLGDDATWTTCAREGDQCALSSDKSHLIKFSPASTPSSAADGFAFYRVKPTKTGRFECSISGEYAAFLATSAAWSYLDSHLLSPEWVYPMHLTPGSFKWEALKHEGEDLNRHVGGTKFVRMYRKERRFFGSKANPARAVYRIATDSIECGLTPQGFGDPRVNPSDFEVECSYWRGGAWTRCAGEGETCFLEEETIGRKNKKNETLVRIGGGGYGFVQVVARGNFACGYDLIHKSVGEGKNEGLVCERLGLNLTEAIAQWVAPGEVDRQISRAAYLLGATLANITSQTPLFRKPNPVIFKLEQEDPTTVFARTLRKGVQQCKLNSQPLINTKGQFVNPAVNTTHTCGRIAQKATCCLVRQEYTKEQNSTNTSEKDLVGAGRGHGRKLLMDGDIDLPEENTRRRRRVGWACGVGGACRGLQFSEIGDLIRRVVKFIAGIPRSRAARISRRIAINSIVKLSDILFQHIPTMVQLSIYYSLSGYLTETFQAQGFKQILLDSVASLVSVVPYAALHTPVTAIKRRMQTEGGSIKSTAEHIWQKYKLAGFMQGFGPEALRQLAFMPIWALVQGSVEHLLIQPGAGHIYLTIAQAIAGAIGGGVAAFIAHPADIIFEGVVKAEPGETDMFKVAKALIQEEGFRSLYRGAFGAAKQQSLQTAIFMVIMSQIRYFTDGSNFQEAPVESDELPPTDEAGTEEWPYSWQFDEWDAVNRSLTVKPAEATPSGDDTWIRDTQSKEIQETMDNWDKLTEEEQAEFIKKLSEASVPAEETTTPAVAT
ncbi:hypothetical protein AAMO2058_000802700 [Amorphochlora amoebiformis]